MSTNAVELRGVGKRYFLGEHLGQGQTLREAMSGLITRRGRSRSEELWSLRDVSLDVPQGDAIGIIGRNGAGKSTLLKIVTRITEPTTGMSRTRGRVGALLEVGTGFHPELTGRENIYLNGAVLGMPRRQVRLQFDEIVDFAGVERFIDTPVKRYSSGMYLRLAFAVAAHLDADIMVVDEVLAVGDAEFQRKCLGKMAAVERSGRTVLFVSHNLDAVVRLCPQAVWLDNGSVRDSGPSAAIVEAYLSTQMDARGRVTFDHASGGPVSLSSLALLDGSGASTAVLRRDQPFSIEARFRVTEAVPGLDLSALVFNPRGMCLIDEAWSDTAPGPVTEPGDYVARLTVPPVLNTGEYSLSLWIGSAYEDFVWEDSPITFRLDGPNGNRADRALQLASRWEVTRTPAPTVLPQAGS
jgi:ABC-type polysaccharide/polyol phosphate transport system ATPase subunit